jgi:hypothetical protein
MNRQDIKKRFEQTVFKISGSTHNKKVMLLAEEVGFEKSEQDPFDAYSDYDNNMYYAILNNRLTTFDFTHVETRSIVNIISVDEFSSFAKNVRDELAEDTRELTFPRLMRVKDEDEEPWSEKLISGYCEGLEFPFLHCDNHRSDNFYGYKIAEEIAPRTDMTQDQIEKALGYRVNIVE